MKLFYSPGACSLAPHIILRETGTPFTLVKVDLGQHKTPEGGSYYELNPKGQVPLLALDDGMTLSEGPVIAQYIAEQAGKHDLLPPVGDFARYKVMEWQNYITFRAAQVVQPPVRFAHRRRHQGPVHRGTGQEICVDQQPPGRTGLPDRDTMTVADPYLFAVTGWAPQLGVDLSQLANVQAFLGRMTERDSVKAALEAEGLAKAA